MSASTGSVAFARPGAPDGPRPTPENWYRRQRLLEVTGQGHPFQTILPGCRLASAVSAGNLGGKRRKRVGYRDGTQTALVSPEEENAGTRGGHRPTACWSGAFGHKGRRPRGLTETRPRGQGRVRRASPLGSVRPATSFRPRRRSSVRPSALSLPTADFGKMEFRARLKSEERKDGS